MDSLKFQRFSDFNHDDPFFDSLKEDYKEFPEWMNKKARNGDFAYVLYDENFNIEGFMYLKEDDDAGDVSPALPKGKHLKIGTFKFESKGTLRGQRFLKKAFDHAFNSNSDDIYVTVFEKHKHLVKLFQTYGFYIHGEKETQNGKEFVYARNLNDIYGDVLLDYPLVLPRNKKKFILAIKPEYHTRLFPDSKLINESPDVVRDVSHTNSIHKIYICAMHSVQNMNRGDIIVIYRMTDGQGSARYRSVASSICVVESVRLITSFTDENSFVDQCRKFSVFSEPELRDFYRSKKLPYIVRFTYNIALQKRPNRAMLLDQVGLTGDRNGRWGNFELTDRQFNEILELGCINESFIVD
ncbi:N-acetyltransferase [Enterobacter ludwigii]|uniref:N-acetyltransferase n=1 Tax=Enterobacter ludwigii TaxID=299767 RepID=UPI003975A8A0